MKEKIINYDENDGLIIKYQSCVYKKYEFTCRGVWLSYNNIKTFIYNESTINELKQQIDELKTTNPEIFI